MYLKLKINVFNNYWREKFTDDGAGWLLLQQIIIAPMSLFTTVILAKILSISDYGFYKYLLGMNAIIAIFGFVGISSIASLNIQRGQDEFFNLAFKYRKVLRWIPSLIAFFVSIYYFYNQNNFLGFLFLLTIFSHLFIETYNFYTVGVSGKGDFKLSAILEIINYFISFFPPILVAYLFKDDANVVVFVFMIMFLCQFVFRYFAFHYVRTHFGFGPTNNSSHQEGRNLDLKDRINFKKESLGLSYYGAISGFSNNAAGVVIFNRLGSAETAIYSLAVTFADFASQFISAPLGKVLLSLSRMTENNKSESEKIQYVKSLYIKLLPLAILITALTMATLPIVYKFLFAKYFFSYQYAVVYSISMLAVIFAPAGFYFAEKRNFKLINIVQVITAILNITSLFFATMYFGIWGAIVITIIMKFVNNLIYVGMVYNRK